MAASVESVSPNTDDILTLRQLRVLKRLQLDDRQLGPGRVAAISSGHEDVYP